jgi:hypothetical protein
MFADLANDEVREIASGFQAPKAIAAAFMGRSVTIVNSTMYPPGPANFNWRDRGVITSVKDQGFYCNCCWAFSAVGCLEAHYMIKYGTRYDLSEQNLIDCNRNAIVGNWGCFGGSQGSAYMYIKEVGLETEETYPYQEDLLHPQTPIYPCRFNASNSVAKLKGYIRMRPRDEEVVKRVVAAVGPVAFAFNGSTMSFAYYEGGIFDEPDCKRC